MRDLQLDRSELWADWLHIARDLAKCAVGIIPRLNRILFNGATKH